jgi:virulence-associated protein VagC
LGKAQAVRIPARFRLNADEVEISEHQGALILRPTPRCCSMRMPRRLMRAFARRSSQR